jgi:hypothetical protein
MRKARLLSARSKQFKGSKFSMKQFSQTVVAVALVSLAGGPAAQTWTPMSAGGKSRSIEVPQSSVFSIPAAIAAKGGTLRVILVGGGEGGSAARGSCDEQAIQGGKGGDGGEVVEVDIPLVAGQCSAGLVVSIGDRGRGALRAGNSSVAGESGGPTTISCGGAPIAVALGGGRRPDAVTAARASKGGAGAVVMNALESGSNESFDQRAFVVTPGADGQTGRYGYGSGGGGGGITVVTNGVSSRADGTVARKSVTRNAPLGKGGYGGGTGAGATGYSSDATLYVAENAIQYGAGGGGGYFACGVAPGVSRDAGNGATGLAKISWNE